MTTQVESSTLAPMKPDILVERARRGDAEAFGRLYESHVDKVYRYLYHRVGKLEDVEDLTSQVFMKAWQGIARYRSRGIPFIAWLLKIAHNAVMDYYRSKKKEVPLAGTEVDERAVDAEEELEHEIERSRLRKAILQLKEDHQRVIVLRFVMGMNHSEVAAIMDKREGAVRVIQHRALAVLRSILTEGE